MDAVDTRIEVSRRLAWKVEAIVLAAQEGPSLFRILALENPQPLKKRRWGLSHLPPSGTSLAVANERGLRTDTLCGHSRIFWLGAPHRISATRG
jgi:hypothetical protein